MPRPVLALIALEAYVFMLFIAVPLILLAWWISLYPRHGEAEAKAIQAFVTRWTRP